jgi:hypothetical protein
MEMKAEWPVRATIIHSDLHEKGQKAPCFQAGDEWPSRLTTCLLYAVNGSMRKTFKYRVYPTKQQQRLLDAQLEECRWLYNELLATRRDAWEQRQESVRLYDQQATLPALKATRPTL